MSSKITPSVRSPEATNGFDLLDTLPEEMFDEIVRLAAQSLRVPFAFFSVIDAQRIWFKAKAGKDINELDVTGSFCAETVLKGSPLVVADATDDTRFAESGIVAGAPYIRFCAGVPVRVNEGQIIGSICVLDVVPRDMAAEDLRILELLGLEIESRLALRAARNSEQRLLDERAILMNLIRNACVACAEDRGRSVLVQAFESRPAVLSFSVSDDGPGVPEGVRQRIFEPYFTYRDSDDPGTGLGLAFARLAAHALDGWISCAPREPAGCEFTLEIPVGSGSGVSSDA